jgi:hypothetical protein
MSNGLQDRARLALPTVLSVTVIGVAVIAAACGDSTGGSGSSGTSGDGGATASSSDAATVSQSATVTQTVTQGSPSSGTEGGQV